MKICFISKYPPIQGGVSASCYWAARGLAERGHNVFVVTNANEVEPRYRMMLEKEDIDNNGEYMKEFPQSGGSVKVYSTEPPIHDEMFYIPQNNPTTSRLATMATDVILREKCEVIFASYFEPFCVAAQLASFWTETPFVVKHAGSDFYRLFENSDLKTGYSKMLLNANRIISGGISVEKLQQIGVDKNRIVENISFILPDEYFRPTDIKIPINNLINSSAKFSNDKDYEKCFAPIEDDSLPILGIYGKLGEFKGTIDLLQAMKKLIDEGFRFYLATMSNAHQYSKFLDAVKELDLIDYVKCIPFRPHWRVPEFIHACSAVTFLERDFPIKAHTPTIPTEILKCGACFIMSEEIAFKQRTRSEYKNLENIIIVPDPKDVESLAKAIRFALEDEDRAREIGRRGNIDLAPTRKYEDYITKLESLLISVASEKPLFCEKPKSVKKNKPVNGKKIIEEIFPITSQMLDKSQNKLFNNYLSTLSANKPENLDKDFIENIVRRLNSIIEDQDSSTIEVINNMLGYEIELFFWKKSNSLAQTEMEIHTAPRPFVSVDALGSLVPSIKGKIKITDYNFDVTKIAATLLLGEQIPYVKNAVKILFPTYSPPRKINKFTQHLLEIIEKESKTCSEIFELLCDSLSITDKNSVEKLNQDYLALMEKLYWLQIVKFSVR